MNRWVLISGLAALLLEMGEAFATLRATPLRHTSATTSPTTTKTTGSSTQLFERQWNFNEGRGPWGLKRNAEVWNGRLAQMGFVIVFLQELIQGHGVFQGIQDGDPINLAFLGATVVTIVGLTGWLAINGDGNIMAE